MYENISQKVIVYINLKTNCVALAQCPQRVCIAKFAWNDWLITVCPYLHPAFSISWSNNVSLVPARQKLR